MIGDGSYMYRSNLFSRSWWSGVGFDAIKHVHLHGECGIATVHYTTFPSPCSLFLLFLWPCFATLESMLRSALQEW